MLEILTPIRRLEVSLVSVRAVVTIAADSNSQLPIRKFPSALVRPASVARNSVQPGSCRVLSALGFCGLRLSMVHCKMFNELYSSPVKRFVFLKGCVKIVS